MKKLNILKLSVVAGLLSIGSSAWANQQDFYAKCTTYSTYFGGYEFYLPSPVQVEPQFVDGMSPNGEVVKVIDNVRHDTWISVLAQFNFEGEYIEIVFSNFRSPSIGHGEVAGESVEFACELLQLQHGDLQYYFHEFRGLVPPFFD